MTDTIQVKASTADQIEPRNLLQGLVRMIGLEPTLPFENWNLNPKKHTRKAPTGNKNKELRASREHSNSSISDLRAQIRHRAVSVVDSSAYGVAA